MVGPRAVFASLCCFSDTVGDRFAITRKERAVTGRKDPRNIRHGAQADGYSIRVRLDP